MSTSMPHRKRGSLTDNFAPIGTGWHFWRRFSALDTGSAALGVRHTARYERVLGTALELQFLVATPEAGRIAEAAVIREIDRLEAIFSAYRTDSELRRWQDADAGMVPVSSDLAAVLKAAADWRRRTEGAFHPAIEALTRLWRQGTELGEIPDSDALESVIKEMETPLWDVDKARQTAQRRTSLPVTLNAIAKGYIIDAVCETAMRLPGVRSALVNIGGDIRHIGPKPVLAAITNPFASQDNAPSLATVWLKGQGLATSGGYRRGFQIGERWYSHLIDPRTGLPASGAASASVIASSAECADVLATAFSIMQPRESLRLADSLPRVGVLIVTQERQTHINALWRKHSR